MRFLKNFMTTTTQNKIKLVTHNGSFHTDDIFAAATLSLYLEKEGKEFEIIRTRDPEIIESGDYVFDVGIIYDPAKNRFDHHQPNGAGKRSNSIDYAAFGLVWKTFGIKLCSVQEVVAIVDEHLVCPIDAGDNGISLFEKKYDISPYLIQNVFGTMSPTWREEDVNIDDVFLKCVSFAKEILSREIIQAEDKYLAIESANVIYKNSEDKKILILDKNYPEQIFESFPETLFVIYPRRANEDWGVRAVKDGTSSFKNRKDFPNAWAGLRDQDMVKASGVSDAIFCHRALFLAVAKSKEGAIKLAQIAVQS
jgi:uncharacterized UPF0160 family protein